VHHAGDARSWGEGVREAFAPRHAPADADRNAVPQRRQPDPVRRLRPGRRGPAAQPRRTTAYGYSEALADGVVRPVVFLAYSGTSSWRTSAGEEMTARLGEPLTAEQTARAWRTALDPGGEWIPAVLAAADRRPDRAPQRRDGRRRRPGHRHGPDHGARPTRRSCATSRARRPSSCSPDEAGASDRIAAFSRSDDRWMVAVRMVSEGVDVPAARRGRVRHQRVDAAVLRPGRRAASCGRGGRGRRRRCSCRASRCCWGSASELEAQRDHVLGKPHRPAEQWDDEELAAANRQQDEPGRTRSRSPPCTPTPSWTS
jgi:hypothetical protein